MDNNRFVPPLPLHGQQPGDEMPPLYPAAGSFAPPGLLHGAAANFHPFPGIHGPAPPPYYPGHVLPQVGAMNSYVPVHRTAQPYAFTARTIPDGYYDPTIGTNMFGTDLTLTGGIDLADPAPDFDPTSPAPFVDRTQLYPPRRHGVLKISNIPYTVSTTEMQQFICKYIPADHLIEPHVHGFPVHIIMERSTGKTMDCFIELVSPETAAQDWDHAFGLTLMRIPRIGQRNVVVEISDQAELMKDMFPRAVCVRFNKDECGAPEIVPNEDPYSAGFRGFITNEELTCMARHAEYPQRSQFAARSLQRTFESMISTVYKFPWYSSGLYTLRQRDTLFKSYEKHLQVIIVKADPSRAYSRDVGLDNKLMMDFIFAGVNCPGFSERQRAIIVESSRVVGPALRLSKHARFWPFQTLSVQPATMSDQDIHMWLSLVELGMEVIEGELRQYIGVAPYFRVVRDRDNRVLFLPTDVGLDISREHFSHLEVQIMEEIMYNGWIRFMHRMGIEAPPTFEEDYQQRRIEQAAAVGNARARDTPSTSTGPATADTEDGTYTIDGAAAEVADSENDGMEEAAAELRSVLQASNVEQSHIEYGRVLRETADEPRASVAGRAANDVAPEIDSLRGVLGSLRLSNNNNGNVENRTRVALNPESASFNPRGWGSRQAARSTPTLEASPFAAAGIGHGGVGSSPQRISTARRAPVGTHVRRNATPMFDLGGGHGSATALQASLRSSQASANLSPTPAGAGVGSANGTASSSLPPTDGVNENVLSLNRDLDDDDVFGADPGASSSSATAALPYALPTARPTTPLRSVPGGIVTTPVLGRSGRSSASRERVRNDGLVESLTFGGLVSDDGPGPAVPTSPPLRRRPDYANGFGSPYPVSESSLDRSSRRARNAVYIEETIEEENEW